MAKQNGITTAAIRQRIKNIMMRGSLGLFIFVSLSLAGLVGYGKYIIYYQDDTTPADNGTEQLLTFPIGVHPVTEEIIENPSVDTFFQEHFAIRSDGAGAHTSWLGRAFGHLALNTWYQNLASASSRILVIQSGERKEQVAHNFKKILVWDEDEKARFLNMVEEHPPTISEGKFYPGTYTVARGASPEQVAELVVKKFDAEILSRYGKDVSVLVPLEDALIIASLLEREAYDFVDMRHIAGVIWNRLFIDMRLQLDATLQYAKGSEPHQPWWPQVKPADKYIKSAFNTYKNSGLPPTAIANPSAQAVLAALNPSKTECMYYFHDKKAGFHCSKTYEEHVASLKKYYGQGK